jgi:hypothetical protein
MSAAFPATRKAMSTGLRDELRASARARQVSGRIARSGLWVSA